MGEVVNNNDDDDFGDIYADAEAQVALSINKVFIEKENDIYVNEFNHSDKGIVPKRIKVQNEDEPRREKPCFAKNEEEKLKLDDESSDSEDDLNIVLNDEDCEGLPVASLRNDNENNDGEDGGGGGGFVVGGEGNGLEGNGGERVNGAKSNCHSQYKYIRPAASLWEDNGWNKPMEPVSCRVDKKHTRGNIDVVQRGYSFSLPRSKSIMDVNIDVLEEKPWRHPGIDATDFFNFGFNEKSWKDYCISLKELRSQTSMLSRNRVYDSSRYIQTKGKAIEVEVSIGERPASMDLKRPWYARQDSDVIQITGQESKDSADSDKHELRYRDINICEPTENCDFSGDDKKDINCIASASGSELSIDHLEGSAKTLNRASVERCSQLKTSSNPTSMDSDNPHCGQTSDLDRQTEEKIKVHTSDETIGALETPSDREEAIPKDLSCSDPCIMQTESSLEGRVQYSPNLSCFGAHSGASEDVSYNDSKRGERTLRRSSPKGMAILKNRTNYDRDGSDKEVHYGKDHSRVYRGRHMKRVHCFSSDGRENAAYYRESEVSHGYRGQSSPEYYNQDPNERSLRHKNSCTFSGKRDQYPRKEWDEREYMFERNIDRVDNEILGRDQYGCERGYAVKDNHFTCMESSRFVPCDSYYSNKVDDGQWRCRSDQHYLSKISINPFHDCEHGEDFMPKNYGTIPFTGRRMSSFDERCLPHGRRDMKNTSRRKRFGENPTLDMVYPQSMENENDYRRHVSETYKESHYLDRRRQQNTRPLYDNAYELRSPRKYSRRHAQVYDERFEGDWVGSCDETYCNDVNINYPDDHFHSLRRYDRQPKLLPQFCDEEMSSSHQIISKYDNPHISASENSRTYNDHKQLKQDRYEMGREESTYNIVSARSNITYSGKYEQKVQRCRDSVNKAVGEGQSSGRCTEAETVIHHNRESSNSKWEESSERQGKSFNGFDPSPAGKEVQPNSQRMATNQNNEKWLDKFPVAGFSEALEIEEGQIVPNKPHESMPVEKNHAPKIRSDNKMNREKVVGKVDNSRILESLAKMEKRRERFKEPLSLKMEPDKNQKSQADSTVETNKINQQRPARKRRWVGF